MKKIRLLVLGISALAFTPSGVAAGTPATVSTTSLAGATIYNQCTGELLLLSGTVHWISRSVSDASGQHDIYGAAFSNVTAVGSDTGAGYVYTEAFRSGGYSGSADSQGLEYVLTLVRVGEDGSYAGGDDFHLSMRARFVTDANGVTRVELDSYQVECS
jgi:hypothetical protein